MDVGRGRRLRPGLGTLAALVLGAVVLGRLGRRYLAQAAVENWTTIFVAIAFQALPFLVLGVVVSGAITAFVPPDLLPRLLPKRPALAVPVAAGAGVVLPGCECGSVPIAGRLMARGVVPAAALAFLLAAPAINPVVLVSTAVAFPGQPEMVGARFLASLTTAVVVGLVWVRRGHEDLVERAVRRHEHTGPPWQVFIATAQHDLLHAGGFLVIGAAAAATLQTVVPRSVTDRLAEHGLASVLVLALFAVLLSICSEADAFVAAGLTQFSLTARLAFLVVGPMVDVKLIALQSGTFGPRFAVRFAPLTFVTAVAVSVVVGGWLL
jgi:uncharacterized membrane protein YraQ (UPF0718 family)